MRPEYKEEEPSVGSRVRLWRIKDAFQHIEQNKYQSKDGGVDHKKSVDFSIALFDEEQPSQYGKTAYAYGDQAEVV
jgi:hypothetical protein